MKWWNVLSLISYKSRDEFCADVRQMFNNCEVFNEDDSPVGKAGHGMRNFFEMRWTEITGAPPTPHPPVHSWGSVRVRSGCNSFAHFYYWKQTKNRNSVWRAQFSFIYTYTKYSFLFFISFNLVLSFKKKQHVVLTNEIFLINLRISERNDILRMYIIRFGFQQSLATI